MRATPPRLLLALALVWGVALMQLSALISMVALPSFVADSGLGLLARIQFGTQVLDLGVLVLVPLAVLLARLVEPAATAPNHRATRSVVLGATAVGAASTFLLLLRLVADLGLAVDLGAGVPALTVPGTIMRDLSLVLVAGAGALWAYCELQCTPPDDPSAVPSRPPAAAVPAVDPPAAGSPPGPPVFPVGPPLAPPQGEAGG